MSNKVIFSVDVEPDLHTRDTLGITIGLKRFEHLCDKHDIKPTLFVTDNVLNKHPEIFKRLDKKGWEISSHGHTHKRFDEMPFHEKESEIRKVLSTFKKHLKTTPLGFRAPQHSIDNKTLDLLEKYGFKYDSSYTPLNLLQFAFFPKKLKLNLTGFFSPLNSYKIRKNLIEIPASSLIIPFVSLSLRIFPKPFIKLYFLTLKLFYKKPVFYAHSWDFIPLEQSRIDKLFNHKKFLVKLDYLMKISK